MTPNDNSFVKEEFQRLIDAIKKKTGKDVKIFVIRGNHDGSSDTSVIGYIAHPLAQYLKIMGDRTLRGEEESYTTGDLFIVGVSYHPFIANKFADIKPMLVKMFTESTAKVKVLLIHNFIRGYHKIPPGVPDHNTYTVRDFDGIEATYIIAGHYHAKQEPFTEHGTTFLSASATEAVDLSDMDEHGIWIIDEGKAPRFIPIKPQYELHNIDIDAHGASKPVEWFVDQALSETSAFASTLKGKDGDAILRLALKGETDSDPYVIDVAVEPKLAEVKQATPKLLYVEYVNTVKMRQQTITLPAMAESGQEYAAEILKPLENSQAEAMKIIEEVSEALDEKPSQKTGLLMATERNTFVNRWVSLLEEEGKK